MRAITTAVASHPVDELDWAAVTGVAEPLPEPAAPDDEGLPPEADPGEVPAPVEPVAWLLVPPVGVVVAALAGRTMLSIDSAVPAVQFTGLPPTACHVFPWTWMSSDG